VDNKNNEQNGVYNIPGVIIPAQTTENGQVIESAINGVNSISTNNSTKQTLNSSDNGSKPEILKATNVVNTPQTPSAIVENINVSNSPTNQINTVPVSVETTNNKAPNGKNRSIVYILIIIILLMIIAFLGYQNYLAPKKDVDPVREWQRKRTVNKDSFVVKKLYNYVNLDGCDNQIAFFYGDSKNVKVSDLSDEIRNYLAYRQLRYNQIERKNCSNYPSALHKNDNVLLWFCGDEVLNSKDPNFNDLTSTTLAISEDFIKRQAEEMFGEDTYKAKTFAISNSARYFYDNKTASYIYQTFYGENSCEGYSNKLDNAYQQGDDLTIVVKVTDNESKAMQMFYYTFTESSNGNYYFKELNKRNL